MREKITDMGTKDSIRPLTDTFILCLRSICGQCKEAGVWSR